MAKPLYVKGLVITVQKYDSTGALAGTATNLCGVNSISWEVGTPDEVDITTFCDLDKVNAAGMLNEGTVDFEIPVLDDEDAGQKLIEDAPLNTRFQIVVEFTTDKTVTFETRKKQETSGSFALSDVVAKGSLQMALIGKPVKSVTP